MSLDSDFLRDLAVRSPERTALSALDIAKGTSLAPPARVILAVRNAAAIAVRNPDSLVVDFERQRVFRDADRVEMACRGRRTHLFALCSMVCSALGGCLGRDKIAEAFYADDEEGGALWSKSVVAKRFCRSQPFFEWAGLLVRHRYVHGPIEVVATTPRRDGPWASFAITDHGILQVGARA